MWEGRVLEVGGGEGRVRWHEAVDGQKGERCAVYLPQGWGTPCHVSPAQLVHSHLLSEGREVGVHLSSSFLHLPVPICTLIFPLAPRSYQLLCMLQGCQCCREGEEELAIKKIALSQTTCMFCVMTDRHLIWSYLLGPEASILTPKNGVLLKQLNHSGRLYKIWSRRAENLSVVTLVIYWNNILSNWDFFKYWVSWTY